LEIYNPNPVPSKDLDENFEANLKNEYEFQPLISIRVNYAILLKLISKCWEYSPKEKIGRFE
jgi:hypothetical protein